MEKVRIIHLSDLHISEHLLRDPDIHFSAPKRYGHDIQVFLALDNFLKNSDWDLLVITGDISRVGNSESFEIVRNWLYNQINVEDIQVGLNLSNDDSRDCIVIPGNHDRFNGNLWQTSLVNYNREFSEVTRDMVISKKIRKKSINFHVYDTTWEKGGFAEGRVDPTDLVVKQIENDSYDVALMHHHFIQPPKHERKKSTELTNSEKVGTYILNSGFNCIMFGHTHKSYIAKPSIEALTNFLNDKRRKGRTWKRLIPLEIIKRYTRNDSCLVSYKRESTKKGQLPTLESYFNFLYIKLNSNADVHPPSHFNTAHEFHEHIRQITQDSSLSKTVKKLKERRVLVSMAPSACQAEAKWNGFNVIEVPLDTNISSYDRYQFNGTEFVKIDRDKYLA